jgi:hypothetical protein
MKASRVRNAFDKAKKRFHQIGNDQAGVIVGLDLEGRWYAVLNGEVLNRVNLDAIAGQSTRSQYLNPGGDGLWPAPEGTALGYEYPTGAWRVPPGLRAARYLVTQSGQANATVAAEVDLINDQGRGIPTIFQRRITVKPEKNGLTVRAVESITYIGSQSLLSTECLLAPWSLCQFDSGPGCEVVFPCTDQAMVWDLYADPSEGQRTWAGRQCRTRTDGSQRYQIAMDAAVPWIEFRNPQRGLTVRRKAGPLPRGQNYIDIRDAASDVLPGKKTVRYSVYSDPSNFMEIEAAGGCPAAIAPNTEMRMSVSTRFVL